MAHVPPSPPRQSAPQKSSNTFWVIAIIAVLCFIGIIYVYQENQAEKERTALRLKKQKEEQAKAEAARKAAEEKRRQEAEAKRQREAEAAAARAAAEEARRQAEEEAARRAAEEAAGEDEESEEEEEEEEEDDDTDEEEGDAAAEAAPGHQLNLAAPTKQDSALYRSLLAKAAAEKDFAPLRDSLKASLDAAYPKLLAAPAPAQEEAAGKEGEQATERLLPALPRKAPKLAKSALGTWLCLDLALEAAPAATKDAKADKKAKAQHEAFCSWLLSSKGKAAHTFADCLGRYKVASRSEAAALLAELRAFHAAEPKKAQREIKAIVNPIAFRVAKKYYPQPDKRKIESGLAKILNRKDKGTPGGQQEAINRLNAFRFVCGVSSDVIYSEEYAEQAAKAAAACRKHGDLSHDLGEYTDVCNLHSGGFSTMAATVDGYMLDPGDNNREKRGHRMWCLHPQLGKCGFGQAETFHAMRVTDGSAKEPVRASYAYPGKGYFPAQYMLGDGWSYYAPSGVDLGREVKVEMWKLPGSVKERPQATKLGKGNAVAIKKIFPNGSFVVFEPDYDDMRFKNGHLSGIYWLRISSGGFTDEYVVEFY